MYFYQELGYANAQGIQFGIFKMAARTEMTPPVMILMVTFVKMGALAHILILTCALYVIVLMITLELPVQVRSLHNYFIFFVGDTRDGKYLSK